MFVFALPGELFAFAIRTPAFEPLFQFPPTLSIAGHVSPASYRTWLSQPPSCRPTSPLSLLAWAN